MHGTTAGDARVVDHDVETAVLGDDRVDERGDGRFVAHVERAHAVGRGDVGAHDDRAFLGEALGGGEAEPRRRAGDQRDLPVDPAACHSNSGSTCLPMSSMVCMTFSCGILYGFTRHSSRSHPTAS